ncbi:hypothetical protein PCE1_000004 [Barthelona sp. PCE]
MSLFGLGDSWEYRISGTEEFAHGSFLYSNIDNCDKGDKKIVIASIQGNMSIFQPQTTTFSQGNLLMEHDFQQPVYQILDGRFVPGSDAIGLAVLHPRSLSVYIVQNDGDSYSIHEIYTHTMSRNVFSMTKFCVDSNSSDDGIVVQSADGVWYFYEQDTRSFDVSLLSFLIPSALTYCAPSDSFICFNSSLVVCSYRYQSLSAANNAASNVKADWTFNIGEQVLDIIIAEVPFTQRSQSGSARETEIILVCEHSIFVLDVRGTLRMQLRLGYFPLAACTYVVPSGNQSILVIATDTNDVLVYQGSDLKWMAKTTSILNAITVGTVERQEGMFLTLSEDNFVRASFLGTTPTKRTFTLVNDRRPLTQIEKRKAKVLKQVHKITQRSSSTVSTNDDEAPMSMNLFVDDIFSFENGVGMTLKVFVSYTGEHLTEAHVSVQAPAPFHSNPPTQRVELRPGSTTPRPLEFNLVLESQESLPGCLEVNVNVLAPKKKSLVQMMSCFDSIMLPLTAVSKPTSTGSLRFKHNWDVPAELKLEHILDDDLRCDPDIVNNIQFEKIGFEFLTGDLASIMIRNGRVVIEGSSYHAISLLTQKLIAFVWEVSEDKNETNYRFNDEVPIEALLDLIEDIHKDEGVMKEIDDQIHQDGGFLRTIQKRLLSHFRSKSPSDLMALHTLYSAAQAEILNHLGEAQHHQKHLLNKKRELMALGRLTVMTTSGSYDIDLLNTSTLEGVLGNPIRDDDYHAFVNNASLWFYATLSRTDVKKVRQTKLRKSISKVFERLVSGHRLKPAESAEENS